MPNITTNLAITYTNTRMLTILDEAWRRLWNKILTKQMEWEITDKCNDFRVSPGGGLVLLRAYYRQRERIFFNRAQFAGLCFLFRLISSFSHQFYTAMFAKSHLMSVKLGFRVFRLQFTLSDSPDLPWSERDLVIFNMAFSRKANTPSGSRTYI